MKKVLALLLALCLVLAMTACSKSESSSGASGSGGDSGETKEPITVTFWNNWSGPDGELLRSLVDEYNKNNTENITIEMQIMEYMALNEKITTAIASDTCPNLHLGLAAGQYAMDKVYLPIDDIWDNTQLKKEDFVPDILDRCYYNGKLYGIPFQVSSMFLYWNKDLFKQAGLDPDKGVVTWEDMITCSAAIDALGGNIIGGGMNVTDFQGFSGLILSYGGNVIVDDNNDGNYRAVLTDPQYIEGNRDALALMKRYCEETNILKSGNLEEGYGSGVVGMLIGGAWETANAKDHNINYGLQLLPVGPKGGPFQSASPMSMCIMKNTDEKHYKAAQHFIAYWNDTHTTAREHCPAYDWSLKQAYQPYLVDVANDPTLLADPTFQITNEYSKHIGDYSPPSFWNTFMLMSAHVTPMIENVVHNRKTIDESLELAQHDLELLIEEMYERERDLGLRE